MERRPTSVFEWGSTLCSIWQQEDWKSKANSLATKMRGSYYLGRFLLGHLKNLVYAEKIQNVKHLRESIVSCVATVIPDMLVRTWIEFENCLDVCCATNGAHLKSTKILNNLEKIPFRPCINYKCLLKLSIKCFTSKFLSSFVDTGYNKIVLISVRSLSYSQ